MRLSTTARMALAAILLALVSGLVPVAFLWHATHDDAIEELRRDTVEQSESLAAVERRAGEAALRVAIEQARAADDGSLVAAIVDRRGTRLAGAGPDRFDITLTDPAFRIERLAADGPWSQREAGFIARRIGAGWLVSGRQLDDWETAQRTIERALFLSMLFSFLLGIAGGLVLTRYVTRRIDAVATTADAVAAGDLARRVVVAEGRGDAFDRLGGRVNAMLDKIERLMGELRIVTDSVAHDLRSPIARLRARAEAALAAEDPAQRDAALAGLVTETEIVTRMLAVLLEISRSEAATRTSFAEAAPAELLTALAELYEPLAEEDGVTLHLALDADPSPMPLHRELLSQALANLVDNALRHAGDSGEIVLRLTAGEGEIRFQVEDRGPGIPAEQQAEARRRFGRLDPARSKPGAGLGLALVEAVARLHGGRLDLGDNGPGLIAAIVLPRG
ncbi:HAMP domain-containing histidine kinase [Sphingomonas cannabina]|uniref:sensor histidine kinase n=1 Tax=Sphingomonas cannabina TaxID=2899123 RepID=UPI001F3DF833|nr:HAMP domain-containing sensor histidine kinase [Sphingomonas cannabina]UIJ44930.1 HAMP domain-containing histidine kinase [Sphingomonas cannabina]